MAGAGDRRLALLRIPAGRGIETDADHGTATTREVFLEVMKGEGVRPTEPAADVPQPSQAFSPWSRSRPSLRDRIWWGAGSVARPCVGFQFRRGASAARERMPSLR